MPLGTMVAGYLQGALVNLDGVKGIRGWQWLFIVCAVITIPIAAFGYFFFPDVPEKTTSRWFSERERQLAFDRLQADGFEKSKGIDMKLFKRVLGAWQFWTFVWMGNLFWLAPYGSSTPFTLWLQALLKPNGEKKYSEPAVNNIGTATSAVSIGSALLTAIYSDWRRTRWDMMLLAGLLMLIGNVLLLVYNLSESTLFAAFMLLGISNGPGNLVVVWAAETFAHDLEARAITLATINATNCMLYLVIPLGAWQTVSAPRYYAGYLLSVVFSVVQLILIPVAVFFQRRDEKRLAKLPPADVLSLQEVSDADYDAKGAIISDAVEVGSSDESASEKDATKIYYAEKKDLDF